jgi:organic hydroperoxide reductase OsmC/OhrA
MSKIRRRSEALQYSVPVTWEGNRGPGTVDYAGYDRTFRVRVAGKPELEGSADPAFRGDGSRYNPEELFLASLAACHMLFYLSLCARQGIVVLAYEDRASGALLRLDDGGGRFERITLTPVVTIAAGDDTEAAVRVHEQAHERCFIAGSTSVEIRVIPTVRAESATVSPGAR